MSPTFSLQVLVVRQINADIRHFTKLETVFSIFHIHFHLLVALYNPKTTMKNALWMHKYTSCKAWGDHAKSHMHLLESFARHSTSVPSSVKAPQTIKAKPSSSGDADQDTDDGSKATQKEQRKLLTTLLKGLVRKYCCQSINLSLSRQTHI